jgi:hypothetical protein
MRRAAGAQRWTARPAVALALVLAAALGGCGDHDFADDPPPPAAITISATITARHVTVSPSRLSAGTIELLASNQTQTSQRLQLRSTQLAGGGDPLAQSTGPINPGGTASLKADVAEGTYVVSARSPSIAPLTIVVGPPRDGARDRLLQP